MRETRSLDWLGGRFQAANNALGLATMRGLHSRCCRGLTSRSSCPLNAGGDGLLPRRQGRAIVRIFCSHASSHPQHLSLLDSTRLTAQWGRTETAAQAAVEGRPGKSDYFCMAQVEAAVEIWLGTSPRLLLGSPDACARILRLRKANVDIKRKASPSSVGAAACSAGNGQAAHRDRGTEQYAVIGMSQCVLRSGMLRDGGGRMSRISDTCAREPRCELTNCFEIPWALCKILYIDH